MLKKAYLEITDICNLNCSFCHGTSRRKGFISVEDFTSAATELRKVTEYLYLHLMGEPLLHPGLEKILEVCSELKFKTVITTNGVLLGEKGDILLNSPALYKVSISLHSFEANDKALIDFDAYLDNICRFALSASEKGVLVSMRLWNNGGKDSLNDKIKAVLGKYFTDEPRENRKGLTLTKNVFLEYGDKFDWPDVNAPERDVRFCMGLRDHIGVLFDGTVVPCCLDADGNIPLGNIFNENIEDILKSGKAKEIYDGFTSHKPTEEMCKRCGYAERF